MSAKRRWRAFSFPAAWTKLRLEPPPLSLAGCALFASLASAPELPPATFTLAILRRDAIVIPFATYDGKRWKDHWREPSKDVDVPINLRSVPAQWWGPGGPLDAWQVWVGANPPRTVHVRQPDWFQTHCSK